MYPILPAALGPEGYSASVSVRQRTMPTDRRRCRRSSANLCAGGGCCVAIAANPFGGGANHWATGVSSC
jgi:hypothetical protein